MGQCEIRRPRTCLAPLQTNDDVSGPPRCADSRRVFSNKECFSNKKILSEDKSLECCFQSSVNFDPGHPRAIYKGFEGGAPPRFQGGASVRPLGWYQTRRSEVGAQSAMDFEFRKWGAEAAGMHWKTGRPAYAQPLSPSRQVSASTAFVTDVTAPNRLGNLLQPPA